MYKPDFAIPLSGLSLFSQEVTHNASSHSSNFETECWTCYQPISGTRGLLSLVPSPCCSGRGQDVLQGFIVLGCEIAYPMSAAGLGVYSLLLQFCIDEFSGKLSFDKDLITFFVEGFQRVHTASWFVQGLSHVVLQDIVCCSVHNMPICHYVANVGHNVTCWVHACDWFIYCGSVVESCPRGLTFQNDQECLILCRKFHLCYMGDLLLFVFLFSMLCALMLMLFELPL